MNKLKNILITNSNIAQASGSHQRVKTLVEKFEVDQIASIRLNHKLAKLELFDNCYRLIHREVRQYTTLDYIKNIFTFCSLNFYRVPRTKVFRYDFANTKLIAHTTKVVPACNNVENLYHVDICDDLYSAYRRAFMASLVKRKFSVRILAYYLEANLERFNIWRIMKKKISVSFITFSDARSYYYYPNVDVIPNSRRYDELYTVRPRKFREQGCVFGVIGDYESFANKTNYHNGLSFVNKLKKRSSLIVFGTNTELLPPSPLAQIYGRYDYLTDLVELFDIGFCCPDLFGGVQNKFIDYMIIYKHVVISPEYKSFC